MCEDPGRGGSPCKLLSLLFLFTILLKTDAKRAGILPGVSRCREHVTAIYPITKVAYTGTYRRKYFNLSPKNFCLFKYRSFLKQFRKVWHPSFQTPTRKKRSLSGSKSWGKRSSEKTTSIRARTTRARLRPLRLGKRFQEKEAKRTKGPFPLRPLRIRLE